jgi:hypothetical protein
MSIRRSKGPYSAGSRASGGRIPLCQSVRGIDLSEDLAHAEVAELEMDSSRIIRIHFVPRKRSEHVVQVNVLVCVLIQVQVLHRLQ